MGGKHLVTGKLGEDKAAQYLVEKGYTILERNCKTPFGELDMITKDGKTLVAIEVKTRHSERFGKPWEAVDHRKQEHIRKSLEWYAKHIHFTGPLRIDVISILIEQRNIAVQHYENIT